MADEAMPLCGLIRTLNRFEGTSNSMGGVDENGRRMERELRKVVLKGKINIKSKQYLDFCLLISRLLCIFAAKMYSYENNIRCKPALFVFH